MEKKKEVWLAYLRQRDSVQVGYHLNSREDGKTEKIYLQDLPVAGGGVACLLFSAHNVSGKKYTYIQLQAHWPCPVPAPAATT